MNGGDDPVKDADGVQANIRVLKLNRVDFEETCQQQNVRSFPSIRLYRRGAKEKTWTDFNGPRNIESLTGFAHAEVRKRHLHVGAHFHQMFTESCRLKGTIEVARVPGTIH